MQKKKHSFIEAVVNIAIGYVVALVAQAFIFPMFGIHVDLSAQAQIAGAFTVVSVIRSYCVRRFFNRATAQQSCWSCGSALVAEEGEWW